MKNKFMTDEEYNACFFDFWSLREKIAQSLVPYDLHPGAHVLDVAAGHGLFAFEIAKIIQRGEVHAIGLENAIFHQKEFYLEQLTSKGVKIMEEKWFYTRRKMTSSQAKKELQFACAKTPKIFDKYHVETVTFETLWNKYKDAIDTHGVAYYSDLCVIMGKKVPS